MPKPIFVVRIPIKYHKTDKDLIKGLQHLEHEYYLLILYDELCESIFFETYNSNEADKVNIQDLKERLILIAESAMERIKNKEKSEEEEHKRILEEKLELLRKQYYYQRQNTPGQIAPAWPKLANTDLDEDMTNSGNYNNNSWLGIFKQSKKK